MPLILVAGQLERRHQGLGFPGGAAIAVGIQGEELSGQVRRSEAVARQLRPREEREMVPRRGRSFDEQPDMLHVFDEPQRFGKRDGREQDRPDFLELLETIDGVQPPAGEGDARLARGSVVAACHFSGQFPGCHRIAGASEQARPLEADPAARGGRPPAAFGRGEHGGRGSCAPEVGGSLHGGENGIGPGLSGRLLKHGRRTSARVVEVVVVEPAHQALQGNRDAQLTGSLLRPVQARPSLLGATGVERAPGPPEMPLRAKHRVRHLFEGLVEQSHAEVAPARGERHPAQIHAGPRVQAGVARSRQQALQRRLRPRPVPAVEVGASHDVERVVGPASGFVGPIAAGCLVDCLPIRGSSFERLVLKAGGLGILEGAPRIVERVEVGAARDQARAQDRGRGGRPRQAPALPHRPRLIARCASRSWVRRRSFSLLS